MSAISNSLAFLEQVGMYDVVLPFLLVFTLVFGVLEKSKILGTEKVDKETVTRKNLNSMVAFCTGFFVVASAQLVALINEFVAMSALVLVIVIMFMMLVGAMHKEQGNEGLNLEKWMLPFTIVIIITLALIFLNGVGWLGPIYAYVTSYWDSEFMGTIILFIIIIAFMWYVTGDRNKKESKD